MSRIHEITHRIEIIEKQIQILQYELRNLKEELKQHHDGSHDDTFTERKILEKMDSPELITVRFRYLHDMVRTAQIRLSEVQHPLQRRRRFV